MSVRQVVLDTETTGLRVEEGHKIIEIACVELIDRKLTGNHFHYYVNPMRIVDAGARSVHGITNEFLEDKPLFQDIAQSFLDYLGESELIIHNAPFDLSFLNQELKLINLTYVLEEQCAVIDTLIMARKMHVGQRNSLDALCKRYGVDASKRDWHGALLDANLLAQVYLTMTGGQGSFFDAINESQTKHSKNKNAKIKTMTQYRLRVLKANENEMTEHRNYLDRLKKEGTCIWNENQK